MRTLRNAVERGRVHHAYLFVGSRGTGKTSMAKILAACLNCRTRAEGAPTVEPCGECESCTAIANATSLDVIEMDAASNNSVDDVRGLRDSVAYAPVSGGWKVYILDEAHMLSPQAWNAFLKTLEEPPPNTVFVLATTEAAKVLPTVVDRCHRFDFSRPGAEQVAEVLNRVAAQERLEVPDAALKLIARSATGSFRDALGTLEQLATYAGTGDGTGGAAIGLEDVLAVLGVPDADLLFDAVEATVGGEPRAALEAVARVADAGRDPAQFVRDLEAHARDLLVVQLLEEVPAELRLTPERDERLAEQAAACSRDGLVRLLDLLGSAHERLRAGGDGRTQLELALVKAAAPETDPSAQALTARLDRLERRLGAGAPASPAPPSAVPDPPAEAEEASPPAEPAPLRAAPAPAPEEEAPPAEGPARLEDVVSLWPAVAEAVRGGNGMLGALIAEARPVALEDDELVVAFPPERDFYKRKAEGDESRRVVAQALGSVAGRSLRLRYVLRAADAAGPDGDGAAASDPDEIVQRFVTEFDAEEIPADEEE